MKTTTRATRKTPIGLTLSTEGIELCSLLCDKFGLSRAGVIELAVRDLAKREQIEIVAKDAQAA